MGYPFDDWTNAPGGVVHVASASAMPRTYFAGSTMSGPPAAQIVHVVHHIEKPPRTNCENCGAPRERHADDCSYCGTEDAF